MDQAITRAAGAPRVVGEFQGYVDGANGLAPSVRWLDRKSMPQVGDRLIAIPARAAVPRSWAILLTSANHGTVGPLGSTFPHAGEHHERVQVVEIVEAGAAPAPGTDLAGLVRLPLTNEQIDDAWDSVPATFTRDQGEQEWNRENRYAFARAIERKVAAQAGQVAVPEKLVADIDAIADELEAEAMNYEGDFADTVKGCAEALRMIVAPSPAKESK